MSLEFRAEGDRLVWVRDPFLRTVTYFTQIHRKSNGFRATAPPPPPAAPADPATVAERIALAHGVCPFCPGNEAACSDEILRVAPAAVPGSQAAGDWLIRVVRNLVARVPETCTGGRNESYVVIEDARHFLDATRGDELLYSGALDEAHFQALLAADVEAARHAYRNPEVRSVLVRKNQGPGSGASQPHVHNQVIGSDIDFPILDIERSTTAADPKIWQAMVQLARDHGFLLRELDGVVAYFSPFGAFPRSFDIVMLDDWVRLTQLPERRRRVFAQLLHEVLRLLGPLPLDYEIHDGPGMPLHAHVNARHFPYSNVGGTFNLPDAILEGAWRQAPRT